MAEANTETAVGADNLTDELLIERYVTRREEAAFAALARRHGPLVLSVCRRVLHHEQDAEDAFQAVFCVLARKAGSIRKRAAVGAWLHGVAYRVARKARAARGLKRVPETDIRDIPAPEGSPEWVWRELRPILDEEVDRLPKKPRQAFVLCYLEGRPTNRRRPSSDAPWAPYCPAWPERANGSARASRAVGWPFPRGPWPLLWGAPQSGQPSRLGWPRQPSRRAFVTRPANP